MICLKDGSITVSSKQLILGSGSPRRRELLAVLGLHPADVRAPDVDETPRKGELPRSYCNRITASKAEALPAAADEVILCADTTVALGRRIMGKPADRDEARAFLQKLSGRRHKVITAVAVRRGGRLWEHDVVTSVKMKRLSDRELDAYLATGDWQGKAGAYGIQGPAGALIPWIQGSFTAVVGLPLAETAGLLQAAGYPLYGGAP
jgi:septum formation protein